MSPLIRIAAFPEGSGVFGIVFDCFVVIGDGLIVVVQRQ